MIRLIATDVDGTLIEHGGPVPAADAEALRAAHARGVRVALATVRVHWTASRIVEQLGIPCALVSLGGATVLDEDGALVRRLTIDLDLARAVAAFADRHGVGLLTTVDGVHHFGPGYVFGLSGVLETQAARETNLACVPAPPERFMVTGERGVNLVLEEFRDAPLRIVRHYRADGSLIDAAITVREATKESGLAALCDRLGVPATEVLAIGDAESDAGMLRWAGTGVAVGNAVEEAKAEADWIAPPVGEGGVAAAVRRFVAGTEGGGS